MAKINVSIEQNPGYGMLEKNFGVVAEPGLLYRPGKAKGHASGLVGSNPTDTSRSIMALAMSSGLDRLGRKY